MKLKSLVFIISLVVVATTAHCKKSARQVCEATYSTIVEQIKSQGLTRASVRIVYTKKNNLGGRLFRTNDDHNFTSHPVGESAYNDTFAGDYDAGEGCSVFFLQDFTDNFIGKFYKLELYYAGIPNAKLMDDLRNDRARNTSGDMRLSTDCRPADSDTFVVCRSRFRWIEEPKFPHGIDALYETLPEISGSPELSKTSEPRRTGSTSGKHFWSDWFSSKSPTSVKVVSTPSGKALNLRDTPSASGNVLVEIPNGTALQDTVCDGAMDNLSGVTGQWCSTEYEGKKGFVFSGGLRDPSNEPSATGSIKSVNALSGLILRDAPSRGGNQLDLIPNGTRVSVISCEGASETITGVTGQWCKISYNGKTGYGFGGFLGDGSSQTVTQPNPNAVCDAQAVACYRACGCPDCSNDNLTSQFINTSSATTAQCMSNCIGSAKQCFRRVISENQPLM